MNKVYGIIIYLKSDTNEQYPFYGLLYDRLYWAEYPLRNLSTYNKYTRQGVDYNIVWREDIIARNGIDAITKSANIDSGGNISNINTFQIRINNTSNIISYLKSLNVSLTGCIVEIIEFSGTDEQSDSQGVNKILTGVIEDGVDGDETTCTLAISTALTRKRRANMAKLIGAEGGTIESEIVPLTFGESDPLEGRYFKAKKLKSTEKVYTVRELFGLEEDTVGTDYDPYTFKRMPAAQTMSSSDSVKLRLGHLTEFSHAGSMSFAEVKEAFIGKYLVCREGKAENVGQYRKIVDVKGRTLDSLDWVTGTVTYNTATITLETEHFPVIPSGNWAANEENQSWFEVVDVLAEYQIESYYETGGFYDSSSNPLQGEVEIYIPEDGKLIKTKLTDVNVVDNNKFEIKPRVYNNSTNKINSYGIIQITDVNPSSHTDWAAWDATGMGDAVKVADGVWVTSHGIGTQLINSQSIRYGDHCDKDIDTYWRFLNHFENYARYWVCVTFVLPQIEEGFKFHKAYLLLRLSSIFTDLHGDHTPVHWFAVKKRRFIGGIENIVSTNENLGKHIYISNFPDSYTGKSTKNRDFEEHIKAGGVWTGYQLFDLNVSSKEEYDEIYKMLILVGRDKTDGVSEYSEDFRLHEIAVAFETEADISGDVFVNYKGRKSGDDLIDNPISIIEHCLRYQNWSEKGIEQNWGHYYNNDSEIIKTNGEGSFNASYLDEIKNKKCAFQILDYSKAWTDSIIKLICNEFYLIHYQDGNGKECLDYMFRTDPDAQLVTYGDTKGQIGALERPKARDINCRPVVKYAYDQYTGEYTKELRVKNVSESTFDESFISGFSGSDGQTIWNQCRELYKIVGSIDDNNEGDIELSTIYRYEDALWHLQKRIELMKKCKLSFSVPYMVGRYWRQGTHIKLQLPHETNNEIRECIIEKVTISKSNDTVNVTVLIDDVSVAPPEIAMIQEVIGQNVEQWQESIGSGEDIQEVITNG